MNTDAELVSGFLIEVQLCLPVKGSSEDQGIVGADLVKAGVVEVLVVDQATGLVDDDERKDGPEFELVSGVSIPIHETSYMTALSFWYVHTNFQYRTASNIKFHLALEPHSTVDERP